MVLDAARDRPAAMTAAPITLSAIAALTTTIMLSVALSYARRSATIRRRLAQLRRGDPKQEDSRMSLHPLRALRPLQSLPTRHVLAIATSMTALLVLGPIAPAAGLALVEVARRANTLLAQRRTRSRIEHAVPDAVELFVLLTHAGLTPVQAVHQLSSTAPEATRRGFAGVTHRLERGDTFADALGALPERLGPSMAGLADLVAAADRYGSPLEPILESLAAEARAARRRRSEADARRLPVRLSFPLVVCTLPSFVLLAVAPAVIAALSSITVPI
jgi:tight adherence protein C